MEISHNYLLREQRLNNICAYVIGGEYYHTEQNYNFLIVYLTVDLIVAFFSILDWHLHVVIVPFIKHLLCPSLC